MKAAVSASEATTEADFDSRRSSHPNPGTGPRTCIVVLGMHRSGTSALTRVLGLLGAALPRHVIPATPSNETGHWEPEKLVKFHDEVLAELDSAWHDWAALDVSRLTVQRRQEIKTRMVDIINDEYGSVSLMVVKDPRICRFAPLFLEALTDAGITPECVLVFRNPAEVAQSLARRDGMPWGQAGLLWLRHVLDTEAATRGNRRTILFYGDLLTDWRSELRRITFGTGPHHSCLGAHSAESAAKQIDGFLNPAQRHHALSNADIISDPLMSGWIADIDDALHQLRRNPASAETFATFDRVYCEFERAAPVISRVQRDLCARLKPDLTQSSSLQQELEEARRIANDAVRVAADEAKAREVLASQLRAIETSRTWRMTAPARWLMSRTLRRKTSFGTV